MEFDRFVAITQGSLLGYKGTLSQQNKLDQLVEAHNRCRKLCMQRELSGQKVASLERKLFLVLLLNSDDIVDQNSTWRQNPIHRHLTGLFSLNHGLTCDVIHRRQWEPFVIEALPGLPSKVSQTLALKWTQFQNRTQNVRSFELMLGMTISFLLAGLTCDDPKLLSEFDTLVADHLAAIVSAKDESTKSSRLALILFALTLFHSSKKICKIIKTPYEEDLSQFYSTWANKTTQFVYLPMTLEVLGKAFTDIISQQSVDDWMGYVDQSSREFRQNRFVVFWPSGEHAPSNMQGLIAHFAYEVLNSNDRTTWPVPLMEPMLKSIAKRYVKEEDFDVSTLALPDKKRFIQSNETPQWQKDLLLPNILLEHFGDLSEDSELQTFVQDNASRCSTYIEAFLEQINRLETPQPLIVELLHSLIMATESMPLIKSVFESHVQKNGISLQLKSPSYDLDLKKLLNTMTRTVTIVSSNLKTDTKNEPDVDYDQAMLLSLGIQAPKATYLALITEAIQNPGACEMIIEKMMEDLKCVVLHSEFQVSLNQICGDLEREFSEKSEAVINVFTKMSIQFPSLRIRLCRHSIEHVLQDKVQTHLKLLEAIFRPTLVDLDNDETLAILSILCHILTQSNDLQLEQRLLSIIQQFRVPNTEKYFDHVLPPSLLHVIDRQIDFNLSMGLKSQSVLERALLMSSLYPSEWVNLISTLEDIENALEAFEFVVCHMDLCQAHLISSAQVLAQALGEYIVEGKCPIGEEDSMLVFRSTCVFLWHIQPAVPSLFPNLATLFFPVLNMLLPLMNASNTMTEGQKLEVLSYLYCVHDFPEKGLLLQRLSQSES